MSYGSSLVPSYIGARQNLGPSVYVAYVFKEALCPKAVVCDSHRRPSINADFVQENTPQTIGYVKI